jgi:hypothetical protein
MESASCDPVKADLRVIREMGLFALRSRRSLPNAPRTLSPADPDEMQQALAHALQFDGRKRFTAWVDDGLRRTWPNASGP